MARRVSKVVFEKGKRVSSKKKKIDPNLAVSIRLAELNREIKKAKGEEKKQLVDEYNFMGKVKWKLEEGKVLGEIDKKVLNEFIKNVDAKRVKKEIGYVHLNEKQEKIFEAISSLLKENKRYSVKDISRKLNISENEIRQSFKNLIERHNVKILPKLTRGEEGVEPYSKVIELNKQRLEKGEPLLIKKGQRLTLKNAIVNLALEGKRVDEISSLLGLPYSKISKTLRKKGIKPVFDSSFNDEYKRKKRIGREQIEKDIREEEERQERLRKERELDEDERILAERRLKEVNKRINVLREKGDVNKHELQKLEREKRRLEGELVDLSYLEREAENSKIEVEIDFLKREELLSKVGLKRDKLNKGKPVEREKLEHISLKLIKKMPWKAYGITRSQWIKLSPSNKYFLRRELYEQFQNGIIKGVLKHSPKTEDELKQVLKEIFHREPANVTIVNISKKIGIYPSNTLKELSKKRNEEWLMKRELDPLTQKKYEIAKKAVDKKIYSEEELKLLIKKEMGVKKVSKNFLNEIKQMVKEEKTEPVALYKFRKGGSEKIASLTKLEEEIVSAYLKIVSKDQVPTINRIKKELKSPLKHPRRVIPVVIKRILGDVGLLRRKEEEGNEIVKEQKRRLETGEPLLIKKGEEPTWKNVKKTLDEWENKQPTRLYKFREKGTEKITDLNKMEEEVVSAYLKIASKDEMPSINKIKKELKNPPRHVSRIIIPVVIKKILGNVAVLRKEEQRGDNIVKEQKRRLETGEPLLIKKGEEPTWKNVRKTLGEEGKVYITSSTRKKRKKGKKEKGA